MLFLDFISIIGHTVFFIVYFFFVKNGIAIFIVKPVYVTLILYGLE